MAKDRKYVYDSAQAKVKAFSKKLSPVLWALLRYFVYSIAATVVLYGVVSIFVSTDVESKLEMENRMYAKLYPELSEKTKMLEDVVQGLQRTDDGIYSDLFHTTAPDSRRLLSMGFIAVEDTTRDEVIAQKVEVKMDELMARSSKIEENFMSVFASFCREDFTMPPMSLPIKGFSFAQSGAAAGQKASPYYKVKVEHRGLDMVVHVGTEVLASASGTVVEVIRSGSGQGNVVGIAHEGGYVTRYAHLQDIVVKKGAAVKEGDLIGHSGMSGTAFAPHLHYEVLRDGVILDPVHYFFKDLTPQEYADIAIMSASVEQSLD